jgi:hypothetical protein
MMLNGEIELVLWWYRSRLIHMKTLLNTYGKQRRVRIEKKYSLEAIFIQKFAKMAIKLLGVRECTPTHLFFFTFLICSIDSTFAHMVWLQVLTSELLQVSVALFKHVTSRITAGSSNMIGPVQQLELFGNRVVSIAPSVYGHRSVSFI